MQYLFDKISETFPKTSSRTKRNLKKLHLGEFSETLVSIELPVNLSDSELEDKLLDSIYEFDDNTFVGTYIVVNGNNIIFQIKTTEFSEDYIKKCCEDLLFILTKIEQQFAEIETINVQYGDAYYGEW